MNITLTPKLKAFILFSGLFLSILTIALIYDPFGCRSIKPANEIVPNNIAVVKPEPSPLKPVKPEPTPSTPDTPINLTPTPENPAISTPSSPAVYTPSKLRPIGELPFLAKPLNLKDKADDFFETDFLGKLNTVPIRKSGFVGIINKGNSCYADSILQALFRIPSIRTIVANLNVYYKSVEIRLEKMRIDAEQNFKAGTPEALEKYKNIEGTRRDIIDAVETIEGLNHMFHQLQTNNEQPASFEEGRTMQCMPDYFADNDQWDADEYFTRIMYDLQRILPESQLHHIFIKIREKGDYITPGPDSKILEPYLNIKNNEKFSLSLDGQNSLIDMINYFFRKDQDAEGTSDVKSYPRFTATVSSLPQFIPFHLMRLTHHKEHGKIKIEKPIKIPQIIDFAPYLNEDAKISGSTRYRLKHFVQHLGGAHGGHYVEYSLEENGQWNLYDDSIVTKNLTELKALDESYYFFYEKDQN